MSGTATGKSTIGTKGGQVAMFGAGCYWGTEKYFRHNFQKQFPKSILNAEVGFQGGKQDDPAYRAVCTGTTGHVEVVAIEFDPAKCTFSDLVRFFFTFHDPTTADRQGNDRGTQYASVIFTSSDEQAQEAKAVIADVEARLAAKTLKFSGRAFEGKKLSTRVFPAPKFFPAHLEHQQYLDKNEGGYCNHAIRFEWAAQPKL